MIHQKIQGVDVPALGFGTYLLTGESCRRGVSEAIELGYRHIDTAQVYGNESDVGLGIQDAEIDRDALFVTTKIWMDDLNPTRVYPSVEESLSKLRMDYVDLLLIHWPTREMRLELTLDAMVALQDQGKALHIGVSNFTPGLMRRALAHARIFCNQIEYHPYLNQHALLSLARSEDVLLTAYSPIARGRVLADPTLADLADSHDKTPVQVVLRWLVQQHHVSAIPKASSAEHRRENIDIFDFELSDEEQQRIADLARGLRLVDPAWAPAW